MAKLANVKERGTTDVGNVLVEGKIRIKFNTKITSMRGGGDGGAMKRKR